MTRQQQFERREFPEKGAEPNVGHIKQRLLLMILILLLLLLQYIVIIIIYRDIEIERERKMIERG